MKKRIYILMAVLALLGAALYGLLSLHSRSSAASAIRDYEEIARSKLIRIIIADTDTTTAVLPALPQRIARQMLRHGYRSSTYANALDRRASLCSPPVAATSSPPRQSLPWSRPKMLSTRLSYLTRQRRSTSYSL